MTSWSRQFVMAICDISNIYLLQSGFKIKRGLDFYNMVYYIRDRAVGRSENPGVTILFGGHNLPPTRLR